MRRNCGQRGPEQVWRTYEWSVRTYGGHVFPPLRVEQEQRGRERRLSGIHHVAGRSPVGYLYGYRPRSRVRRRQHIDLSWADEVHVGRFAIDGHAGPIELCGQIGANEIGRRPEARGPSQVGAFDGHPRALRKPRQEAAAVIDLGDEGSGGGPAQGEGPGAKPPARTARQGEPRAGARPPFRPWGGGGGGGPPQREPAEPLTPEPVPPARAIKGRPLFRTME